MHAGIVSGLVTARKYLSALPINVASKQLFLAQQVSYMQIGEVTFLARTQKNYFLCRTTFSSSSSANCVLL